MRLVLHRGDREVLEDRLKERVVRSWSQSSELASHVMETGHRIGWEEAAILSKERVYFNRIFKEAWFSRVSGSSNRVFHQLDGTWSGLF